MKKTFSIHPRPKSGFTLIELLVVITIIILLTSIMLPAINGAREAARKSLCSSNLRQMAIAANTYHEAKKKFPSSIRPPGLTPLPRIAGLTLLLPFIEQDTMYDQYDQTKNWFDPPNLPITSTRVAVFQCPSSPDVNRLDGVPEATPWSGTLVAVTDYSPTIGVDPRLKTAALVLEDGPGILPKNGTPSLSDVKDGLTNTIMYAESAGRPFLYQRGKKFSDTTVNRVNAGGWSRPASDFSIDGATADGATLPGPVAINATNGEDFGTTTFPHPYYGTEGTAEVYSFHVGGAFVVFGDASIRFVNQDINIGEFAKLVTRAGREVVKPVD